jgi:hypothetical protein
MGWIFPPLFFRREVGMRKGAGIPSPNMNGKADFQPKIVPLTQDIQSPRAVNYPLA